MDANSLLAERVAALAAVDAPAASYLMHVGSGVNAGVTVEQVQNILVAVAPISAIKITETLGVVVAEIQAELEAEQRAQ